MCTRRRLMGCEWRGGVAQVNADETALNYEQCKRVRVFGARSVCPQTMVRLMDMIGRLGCPTRARTTQFYVKGDRG